MRISNNNQIITLDAEDRKHGASLPISILTCKQFLRLAKRKKSTCYQRASKNHQAPGNFDGEHWQRYRRIIEKYNRRIP